MLGGAFQGQKSTWSCSTKKSSEVQQGVESDGDLKAGARSVGRSRLDEQETRAMPQKNTETNTIAEKRVFCFALDVNWSKKGVSFQNEGLEDDAPTRTHTEAQEHQGS